MPEGASSNVLMLVQNCPYPQDTRVRLEAEALHGAGYPVAVIAQGDKGQPWHEVVRGVHVYRYPAPIEASSFLGYLWEYGYSVLAAFVLSLVVWARRGVDIIHSASPPDVLVVVAALYKLFGKRYILDHHDLSPEMFDAIFGGGKRPIVRRTLVLLEKASLRLADHVIATNESYKQVEIERAGVAPDRITVVRNGPDLAKIPLVLARATHAPNEKTRILYVGSMGKHDGLDYLLRSLKHVVSTLKRTDFACVLVGGRGGNIDELKSLKTALGLDAYVQFTGWVPEEEKRLQLTAADICVDPDPRNPFTDRSTMTKVAEYMAFGKPIVAFDLRENHFTAQEAALFATPNDELAFARALVELMDDPARRQAMGAFGRHRAEASLDWKYSIPNLLSVYGAVTRTAKRRVPRAGAMTNSRPSTGVRASVRGKPFISGDA